LHFCMYFFFFFFNLNSGIKFLLARQVLYHLSHMASPFCSIYLFYEQGIAFMLGTGLDHDSTVFMLPF
jgi:hypothetical protein